MVCLTFFSSKGASFSNNKNTEHTHTQLKTDKQKKSTSSKRRVSILWLRRSMIRLFQAWSKKCHKREVMRQRRKDPPGKNNKKKSTTTSSWRFQPNLKNISQNGNLPQVGMKIKHIWNHHLVFHKWKKWHPKRTIICKTSFGKLPEMANWHINEDLPVLIRHTYIIHLDSCSLPECTMAGNEDFPHLNIQIVPSWFMEIHSWFIDCMFQGARVCSTKVCQV